MSRAKPSEQIERDAGSDWDNGRAERHLAYQVYNGHGDVVQLAGEDSSVGLQYDYDAYGNQREITGQDTTTLDSNPFRYSGEYFDLSSGTYYLRNRNYDPAIGGFTSEDPAQRGLNWYAYCDGNPIMFVDPFGLVRVNIEEYAKAMGATTSIYQKGGKDYISVTYGGTSQNYTYSGSKKIDDSTLNSRFNWENSWIPNGKKEAVYTGVHEVAGFTKNYHTSIIIFAAPGSTIYDDDDKKWQIYDGGLVKYTTIGAGPKNGNLTSELTRPDDIRFDNKVQMISMGVYDADTIENLFAINDRYGNNVNYDLWPSTRNSPNYGSGYNSNSFTAGLLGAANISQIEPQYFVPGWDKPLPVSYFGLKRRGNGRV